MAANSFLLKAWAVTLVAALFALGISTTSDRNYVFIAYLPALAFWTLDAYYLRQERLFRHLYDAVRIKDEKDIDYSLDTRGLAKARDSWLRTGLSVTLLLYYGGLIAVTTIVAIAMKG
jgi:hypothetical protein